MTDWRVAESLDVLLAQINKTFPNRSKASDGGIGNAEHASRSSDHNPWVMDRGMGVVTARDFTHDPAHGLDSEKLAQAVLDSRDDRIKYVISNKKICAGSEGPQPWVWRPYKGDNPHNHHCHLSVKSDKKLYDSTAPWVLDFSRVNQKLVSTPPPKDERPLLKKGDGDGKAKDGPVRDLQRLLNKAGAKLDVDGDFGGKTFDAVVAFQKKRKLVADGKVGGYTWKALEV